MMDAQEAADRQRVCDIARTWLRTRYHDCACVKGAGVDCAQIIRAVFEEAQLEAPIKIEPYSPQWFLHRSREKYIEKVLERAHEITEAQALPADIVLYKIGRCYAHGAIIVDPGWPRIVHAYKPARTVIEDDGSMGPLGERPRRFFSRW